MAAATGARPCGQPRHPQSHNLFGLLIYAQFGSIFSVVASELFCQRSQSGGDILHACYNDQEEEDEDDELNR
ncbi:hypothetical protein M5K25_028147 [Dendrobium thyrsiflorum]|uniref:Uncharacterized protein n=1 Tax=Dendrobium thyrsiflorum TaxID=117978 RepID=A0ABD0TVV4_DENTH